MQKQQRYTFTAKRLNVETSLYTETFEGKLVFTARTEIEAFHKLRVYVLEELGMENLWIGGASGELYCSFGEAQLVWGKGKTV
jgi:hypothetical protein